MRSANLGLKGRVPSSTDCMARQERPTSFPKSFCPRPISFRRIATGCFKADILISCLFVFLIVILIFFESVFIRGLFPFFCGFAAPGPFAFYPSTHSNSHPFYPGQDPSQYTCVLNLHIFMAKCAAIVCITLGAERPSFNRQKRAHPDATVAPIGNRLYRRLATCTALVPRDAPLERTYENTNEHTDINAPALCQSFPASGHNSRPGQ